MAWQELLGIAALAALAVLVVWESVSSRKLSRDELRKGFKPGRAASQTALVILAGFLLYFGIEEWIEPSRPPFHGRGAWFESMVYSAFGPRGLPVLCWALAAITVLAVLAQWRKR